LIPASTGLLVGITSLGQLSDATNTKLVFTKTVGTTGIASQKDMYTATGSNTNAYSWAYTAEALSDNPTKLYVTVKKTAL
jgi:hypothetical protein